MTINMTLCTPADEAKSVLHFKLRVLDLVELYIRKEPTNPLILVGHVTTQKCPSYPLPHFSFQDMVVPLYELIHAAQSQKESSPLVKRVTGIFKNKLCHMKDVRWKTNVSCLYKIDVHVHAWMCMYI